MRSRGGRALCAALAGWVVGLAAASVHAAGADAADAKLTAEDIYSRVLGNRFREFSQDARMASGDRTGRVQEARMTIIFKDFRDEKGQPVRGVDSKVLIKYTHPFDLRHSGYLAIQNDGRVDDHFLYLPSRRRIVRVNLHGKAVFGTDFSFEDVIPHELEDATYVRLEDTVLDDSPVFVVEAHPTALLDSAYSKFIFYVDKRRFVPLRVRYFDLAGVEVKELRTRPQDVQDFDGVQVPMKITMRNLLLDSFTTFEILSFDPNPHLPDSAFDLRRLEQTN
jgi:outer membrane lipoprotein-sorting protein